MRRVGEAMQRKRWGGGGLLLLVLLAVLLVAPLLRHRGTNHPLAASQRTDLCPLLPAPPPPLAAATGTPQAGQQYSGSCEFRQDAGGPVLLRVMMSSTRQLSTPTPARTAKAYATWITETAVSTGQPMAEVPGEWTAASSWQAHGARVLLFEDHGILVYMESTSLDAAGLAAYAASVAAALRSAHDAP
jgi:hypothetical protein